MLPFAFSMAFMQTGVLCAWRSWHPTRHMGMTCDVCWAYSACLHEHLH